MYVDKQHVWSPCACEDVSERGGVGGAPEETPQRTEVAVRVIGAAVPVEAKKLRMLSE